MKIASCANRDYETKAPTYFAEVRSEMLGFIPTSCRRVLDVGCSSGGFGALLKHSRQVEVWGVEPVAAAAEQAGGKLDRVIHDVFPPETELPAAAFDCVVFNDVLEHLIDPGSALSYARRLLAPGGVVVASIPNIRHFLSLWDLVVHGEWNYREYGILDRTHLRFFTRKSIEPLFKESGFTIERLQGINEMVSPYPAEADRWRYYRALNALTFGAVSDMRYLQYAVVAKPDTRLG